MIVGGRHSDCCGKSFVGSLQHSPGCGKSLVGSLQPFSVNIGSIYYVLLITNDCWWPSFRLLWKELCREPTAFTWLWKELSREPAAIFGQHRIEKLRNTSRMDYRETAQHFAYGLSRNLEVKLQAIKSSQLRENQEELNGTGRGMLRPLLV
jgi:hypothetical protein